MSWLSFSARRRSASAAATASRSAAAASRSAFLRSASFLKRCCSTYTEPSTGNTYFAFKSLSMNIGQTHNRGIDWDMTARHRFDFGNLTANLSGTHMLKADYTVPGTKNQWT